MAVLFGRYEYVAELGRGAGSRVVQARDLLEHGAGRALKIVGPEHGARLGWELTRLSEIEHPNLSRVRELLRVEQAVHAPLSLLRGSFVLVTDLAHGLPVDLTLEPLRDDLRALLAAAFRMAIGVAEALAAVHRAGLVHGDVKPANVLATALAKQVTLIDLGAARPPGFFPTVQGTPDYLAPEAWAGTCSFAQDTYALGATLFDLIQGEEAAGPSGSMRAPWRVRDLGALPRDVPSAWVELLRRMLNEDPDARPSDAARLLAQLHALGRRLHLGVPRSAALYATGRVVPSARELGARALSAPFVGHAALRDRLTSALEGTGVVLVVGPPGAGRTRLTREALCALQLRCVHQGKVTPTLLTDLSVSERIDVPCAIVQRALAQPADVEQALRAVEAWRRSGRALSVVLELEPGRYVPRNDVAVVEVGALDVESERALLRSVLGAEPGSETLDAAHRASAGYAGRLCALLSQGLHDGRSLTDASEWQGLSVAAAWLGSLGTDALRLARLLALASEQLSLDGAARLLGGVERVTRARDELRARGLLRDGTDGRAQLDDDVAARVRGDLGGEARALARELSHELGTEHGATWVWLLAGESEQAEAALLADAARAKGRGEPRAAVAMLREALPWLDTENLRCVLGDAERALGRYDAARAILGPCDGAAACLLRAEVDRLRGQPALAAELLATLLQASDLSVRERAQALFARVSFDLGDVSRAQVLVATLPGDVQARLRAREVRLLLEMSDAAAADAEASRLLAEARQHGEGRALSRALMLCAHVSVRRGQFGRAADELREALVRARDAGEAHEAATIATNLGLVELDAGDLGAALATLRAGTSALVWLGRDADLARALYNLGNAAWLVGDAALAETTFAESRERAASLHDETLEACLTIAEAELAMHRGALEGAHAMLSRALARPAVSTSAMRCLLASRAACAAVAAGRPSAAATALASAEAWLSAWDPTQLAEVSVARARSSLARGDAQAAEQSIASALDGVGDRLAYEARVRLLLAGIDSAHASGASARAEERALQCRALLERALASLPPDARATFRALPPHARVLVQGAAVTPALSAPAAGASRALLVASRRLFEATSEARLARAAVQIALELVHAERALLIVQAADGTADVLATASLGAAEGLVYSRSIVERVWADVSVLVAIDAQHDVRLDGAQSVHALGVRSVIAVPVRGFGARAVLYLDDRLRSGAFGAEERELLSDLAELVGAAFRVVASFRHERLAARQAQHQLRSLEARIARHDPPIEGAPLIGESRALQGALQLARRVAESSTPVLIQGESGTGKELLARFIHERSERSTRPFVAESCAALPEGLLESALFGHERGAFTGADRARMGLFEAAHTGTLFLDEVAEMSPALQAKLLRVLQDGEVRPVGSEKTRHVDVRIVSATHRDLAALVRERRFREDLFYRLAVVTVELPPLRCRLEDVPLLVAHFLKRHGARKEARIDPEAMQALQNRAWPGNVRQLESEIQRALALCDGVIGLAHLSVSTGEPAPLGLDLRSHADALQRQLVRRALDEAAGNQTRAATLLGVSRFGLQKMLKRLGFD